MKENIDGEGGVTVTPDITLLFPRTLLKKVTFIWMSLSETNFKNQHPFAPSIDRLDNSLGYTEANCKIIVFSLNAGKSNFNLGDCIKLANALC